MQSKSRCSLPGARLGAAIELVRTGMIEQVKVVRGDVRDQNTLQRAVGEYEINTVIHLAAQAIVKTANADPAKTMDTNVRGTWDLLEACRQSRMVKQVVLASTDKVYGDHWSCHTMKIYHLRPATRMMSARPAQR